MAKLTCFKFQNFNSFLKKKNLCYYLVYTAGTKLSIYLVLLAVFANQYYNVLIFYFKWTTYTRQQKKRIFLLSRFTSLKVMIFSFLLSKRICLCMAFSCHNAIRRKNMQSIVKNGQSHKILAQCVKN